MKKILPLLTFLIVFAHLIFAQKPLPMEFGKIPIEDLQMKTYIKDSAAEAVVLGDYGDYSYSFLDGYPFIIYKRHIRIKILKKSGFDRANIKIGYRVGYDNKNETIQDFKATTYNLEDGGIKPYPIDAKSVFEDKANKAYYYKTFTFPQVREGSIIEYSYEMESGIWYDFRSWIFQKDIPVVWSELRSKIPGYFTFNLTFQSLIPLHINENEEGKDNFMRGSVRDPYLQYRFVMKDLPALKTEPYLTTVENFRSKIDFELSETQFPNQVKTDYSKTWEALNTTLLMDENFGKAIKRFDKAEGIAKILKPLYANDTLALITAAYKHLQSTMQWNEIERFGTDENLDKIYEKRIGTSAEINLMLVRLLRECGLEANPLIISTRENGKLSDLVLLDRFNYVIAHVMLGGKDFMLDATSPLMTAGMLPIRCLNERGRLIAKKGSRWVTITPSPVRRKITMNTMTIGTDQSIKGTSQTNFTGHSAADFRNTVLLKGKEAYLSDYKKNRPNQTIESLQINNLDSLEKELSLSVKTTFNEAYSMAGERMYLTPMMGEGEDSNPFKVSERQYPIDFGVPQEETYIANFSLPEGYVVEEMPKTESILLPNNGGRFLFSCINENGWLKITSKITLKKAIYSPEEYQSLREFYNRIVSKHAEQVVLKKK
jgi:Domain of Unknown Function with PDB structure (DUF3857)